MASTTIPQSDEVALAEIRGLADRLGSTPGRNQLMSEFGWGASRSTRLLRMFEKQSEDRSGEGEESRSSPDDADQSDGAGPVCPQSDDRSGTRSAAVRSDSPSPVRTDREQSTPGQPAPQQTGPVASPSAGPEPGPPADWQSAGSDCPRSGEVAAQTGPVPPAVEEGTRLVPGPPPVQSDRSASPAQSTPADRTALPEQTDAPDQTGPAQADRTATPGPGTPGRTVGPAAHQTTPDRTDADRTGQTDTGPKQTGGPDRRRPRHPWGLLAAVLAIALSAFVAIWGGWVGLGRMVGFGPVDLLPGIGKGWTVDLAIALPLGIEAYAAAALYVAVGGLVSGPGRAFAAVSAGAALVLGAFGQATYHLLEVAGEEHAPDWVVVFVSVLPVIVLGAAGVLLHLVLEERKRP